MGSAAAGNLRSPSCSTDPTLDHDTFQLLASQFASANKEILL